MTSKRWRAALAVALAGLAATGCGGSSEPDLVVYSGASEQQLQPILEEFARAAKVGIAVRFGDTMDLAATVLEQGDRPRADVFIGQDASALARLARRGRLARYDSPAAARVPARYRAPNRTWVGLVAHAGVVMVNTERVPPARRPRSIFDVTDPRWKGRVAAPSATNASWIAFVSELRLLLGDQATERFLQALKRNGLAVLSSPADVRRAVASGKFDLGLVSHRYVERERRAGSPVEAIFTDQGPGGIGVMVNVAAGGILRGARHPENARRLLDHLLRRDVQAELAGRGLEYPVVPGVPAPGLRPLASVKQTDVELADLGGELDATLALLAEVGLK